MSESVVDCPRCADLTRRWGKPKVCNAHLPAEAETHGRLSLLSAEVDKRHAAYEAGRAAFRDQAEALDVCRQLADRVEALERDNLRLWRRQHVHASPAPLLVTTVDAAGLEALMRAERKPGEVAHLSGRPCSAWWCRLRRWWRR